MTVGLSSLSRYMDALRAVNRIEQKKMDNDSMECKGNDCEKSYTEVESVKSKSGEDYNKLLDRAEMSEPLSTDEISLEQQHRDHYHKMLSEVLGKPSVHWMLGGDET